MRQAERNNIFNNCQARIKKATLDYLQARGYFITKVEDMYGVDDSILGDILPYCKEYSKLVKVVSDGVRVTDSKLEKMLKCIYAIEDIVAEEKNNEHDIRPLIKEFNEVESCDTEFWMSVIIIVISSYFITPYLALLCIVFYAKYKQQKKLKEKISEDLKHRAAKIISKI